MTRFGTLSLWEVPHISHAKIRCRNFHVAKISCYTVIDSVREIERQVACIGVSIDTLTIDILISVVWNVSGNPDYIRVH